MARTHYIGSSNPFASNYDYICIPKNRILNLEAEFNYEEKNKINIECFEPFFWRKEDCEKMFKGKEENEMEKIEYLLNIYENYQVKKIKKERDEKIEKIQKESPEHKILEKVNDFTLKELQKIFKDYDENKEKIMEINLIFREETDKKIKEIIKDSEKECSLVDLKIQEVKSLLRIAETFEQKMEILKNYDILDKNGRINKD